MGKRGLCAAHTILLVGGRHIACVEQFNGQFGCIARQNTERAFGRAGQEGDDAYFHGACVLGLHRWRSCNQTGSDGCRNLGLAEYVDIYSGLIDSSAAGSSESYRLFAEAPDVVEYLRVIQSSQRWRHV